MVLLLVKDPATNAGRGELLVLSPNFDQDQSSTHRTGNPRIFEVRVALVMRCPHSSSLGMTKSKIDEKSNKTLVFPPCPDVARTIPTPPTFFSISSATLSFARLSPVSMGGESEGKVESAVATAPSGTLATTFGPTSGSKTA